jgi:transcriptional regulator with XRE-family HTH domain
VYVAKKRNRTVPIKKELLKQWRRAQGLTQEALADKCKLSKRTIENAENGHELTTPTVTSICNALGKKPEDLISDGPNEPDPIPPTEEELLESLVLDSMGVDKTTWKCERVSVLHCGRIRRVEMCYEMLLAVEWPLRDLQLFVAEVAREPRDADTLIQKVATSQFDFATATRLLGFRQARHWPEFQKVFEEIRGVIDQFVNKLRAAKSEPSFWSDAPRLAEKAINQLLELNNRLKRMKSEAAEKI